ncbi:MAG: hypothetical protein EOO65_03705, partial [Methanosarcinales archaeon]
MRVPDEELVHVVVALAVDDEVDELLLVGVLEREGEGDRDGVPEGVWLLLDVALTVLLAVLLAVRLGVLLAVLLAVRLGVVLAVLLAVRLGVLLAVLLAVRLGVVLAVLL